MPTAVPALMAAGGWLLSAVVAFLVAPHILDEVTELRSDRQPAEGRAGLVVLVVAPTLVAYVGWVWWSVVALVNARRISPLAGSPMWPVVVYIGGPLVLLAGSRASADRGQTMEPWELVMVFGALLCTFGHLTVLVSLRSAGRRVGVDSAVFTRLLWVPILAAPVRLALLVVVARDWPVEQQVLLDLGVQVVLSVWMAWAVRDATTSFDQACRAKLLRRNAPDEVGVPPAHVIAAALRRSWEP